MPVHAFRSVVEAREFERLGEVFAEHVVLHSPIAHKPYGGREMVVKIVALVASIFEDFAFQREIGAATGGDHALMFAARVGDMSIQGCDFLHTDADGLVDEITVMLRPLKAVQAFEEKMRVQFAATIGDHLA
jgi:SnoaL-like domain